MKEKEILLKLSALNMHVNKFNKDFILIKVEDYEKYILAFMTYWGELKKINSELYSDFIPSTYYSYNSTDKNVPSSFLLPIANDMKYILDIAPDDEGIKPTAFKITNEGIFFAGQYFDALIKFSEILKIASSEIILIDGYINDNFLDIFTAVNSGVYVKILTKAKSITPSLDLKVISFNKQYSSNNIHLEIKSNEDFHDRFLIIDNKDFYHFGASFKDLGNKGFMFSRIEEPFVQTALLKEFNSKW